MTKLLHEVVRETQQIEEQFEQDAPYLLERLASADLAQDDTSVVKLYAHSVAALGRITDEIVESRQESAQ